MRSQDIIIIIPELLLIFGLQVPGIVSLILILGSCLLILATLPLSLIAVIKVVQVSLLVNKRKIISLGDEGDPISPQFAFSFFYSRRSKRVTTPCLFDPNNTEHFLQVAFLKIYSIKVHENISSFKAIECQ